MWAFLNAIGAFLYGIRRILLTLVILGLPVAIYFVFFAKEPVFSVENDVELGRQGAASFEANPEEYPVLPEEEYPEAYAHLNRIVQGVVGASDIQYRELFAYDDVKIIDDDEVLNAFCMPGGYIYVYTGLIRYLDREDHLAGVLGHEIAHAENRHSSLRLQREYGVKNLSAFVLLTNPMTIGDFVNASILRDLVGLDYSRDQEAQADEYSVRYLADSAYACDGTAGFFEKLLDEGKGAPIPEFLSDHPDSAARVRDVRGMAEDLGCGTEEQSPERWRAFQASLPAVAEEEPEESETTEAVSE